MIKDRREL